MDITNLQRQILFRNDDVGRPKLDSAIDTLHAYNPDVNIIAHDAPLTSVNAMEIIRDYDVIINGADNFPARYLVSDAAYLNDKPLVDGSILIFDGQATVYLPGKGCYRCLFPAPPPPGEVPSCAEAGVLGMLPGLVGSIQAIETVKLIMASASHWPAVFCSSMLWTWSFGPSSCGVIPTALSAGTTRPSASLSTTRPSAEFPR